MQNPEAKLTHPCARKASAHDLYWQSGMPGPPPEDMQNQLPGGIVGVGVAVPEVGVGAPKSKSGLATGPPMAMP